MPSFDIVSEVDLSEVENAMQNAAREIATRYDFKGSKSTAEHKEGVITVFADDDRKLQQMHDVLKTHLHRRGIEPGQLDLQKVEPAAGQPPGRLRMENVFEQEYVPVFIKTYKADADAMTGREQNHGHAHQLLHRPKANDSCQRLF